MIIALLLIGLYFFVLKGKKTKHPFPSFVKGPKSNFIIGNGLDFGPDNLIKTLKNYPAQYGKFVQFYLGPIRSIMITDLEFVKEIFMKRPKKFQRLQLLNYAANKLGLDSGLFFAESSTWTRIRKATTPSFSNLNLSNKYSRLVSETFSWVNRLKNQLEDNPNYTFDMKYESFTFTIRTITVVAFGLPTDHPITSYFFSKGFQQDIEKIFKFMGESSVWALPRIFWRYSSYYQYELAGIESSKRFEQKCQEVIDYKRKLIQESSNPNEQKYFSMIDSLLVTESNVSEKGLIDAEIIANAKVFYLAGTDTTAVTMSWISYYFALYPECLRRVREETKAILFQSKDPLTYPEVLASIDMNKCKELKYSLAVVKETLRLAGPAPTLSFETVDESFTLSNGITIEPGDTIWLNQDGIHLDPEVFMEPEKFLPDRWLTKDIIQLNNLEASFLPFGFGPRICPGMNLALQEGVLGIAFLAYFFDFALDCPVSDIVRKCNFVAIANQMPIKLSIAKH